MLEKIAFGALFKVNIDAFIVLVLVLNTHGREMIGLPLEPHQT